MERRLEDRVAVITGACSGIGEAIATEFVKQGAKVVLADRQEPGEPLRAMQEVGAAVYARTDVLAEADIQAAIAVALERFGGLDILVNNAGAGGTTAPITDVESADWDQVFDLIVRGPMLGMKHAVPIMRSRGGGAIVNMSSAAGLRPLLSAGAAYAAAKAAVLKLSTNAAIEFAPYGVRVNTILPGAIVTPIFGAGLGLTRDEARSYLPEVESIYVHAQPLPVTGLPVHVAKAALFLASDEAAFLTGAEVVVDGGLTLVPGHWSQARDKMKALAARIGEARA